MRSPSCIMPAWCLLKIGGQVSTCVAVTPMRWQRNLNLCDSPHSSSEVFGSYISLHSARPACWLTALGLTNLRCQEQSSG
jgi:hypothetical protein